MKPYEMWMVWNAFLFLGIALTAGVCKEKDIAGFFAIAAFLLMSFANVLSLLK